MIFQAMDFSILRTLLEICDQGELTEAQQGNLILAARQKLHEIENCYYRILDEMDAHKKENCECACSPKD